MVEDKAGIEIVNLALVGEKAQRKWKWVFRPLVDLAVITDYDDVDGHPALLFSVSSSRCSLLKIK